MLCVTTMAEFKKISSAGNTKYFNTRYRIHKHATNILKPLTKQTFYSIESGVDKVKAFNFMSD